MLDKTKVSEFVARLREEGAPEEKIIMPDIWDITMEYFQSKDSQSVGGRAGLDFRPIAVNADGTSKIWNILDCNEVILQMSTEHRRTQNEVVKQIRGVPEFLSNKYKDTNPHKEFNRNIPHMSIDDINRQWKKYSDSLANFSIPLLSNIAGYFDASYLTDIRNYVGALLALPIFISPIVSFTTFFSACVSFSHIVYSMNTAYFRHYTMVEARRRFGTYDGVYLSGVITAKCLLVVYILRSFWQMVKSKVVLETQGNLAPLSMEEVTLNSAQTNCWLPIPIQKIETVAPKTYVANDVLEICKKNIALIVNGSKFVNGFFISQNFVLVPKHFMDECSRSYDQSLKIV